MSVLVDDVYTALTTASVIGGATGWTGYKVFWPDDSTKAILIREGVGPTPDTRWTVDEPTLQIWLRGDENEHEESQTKMKAVIDALHNQEDAVGAGYVYLIAEGSGYNVVGLDPSRRALFSMSFRVMRDA